MRILFKILAAPFVVVLTVSWAVLFFVFCFAETILSWVSALAGILAIVFFIAGMIPNGIVFAVLAFLVSPVGLPAVANWLIDRLGDMNSSLKHFITT